MNLKQHVRVFHVTLATLTILAFISGDFGVVQDILGYGVVAIIALRLLWVLFNPAGFASIISTPISHGSGSTDGGVI